MRKILLVLLAALASTAIGLPAQAADGASFDDPAGDGLEVPLPAAAASDDTVDILKVTIRSDGKAVIFTALMKAVGTPRAANGEGLRFIFSYMKHPFDISIVDDVTGYRAATLRDTATTPSTNLSCGLCVATVDKASSTITFKAPIASLSAGMRRADGKLKTLEKGSKLTGLSAESAAARGFGRNGVGHGYSINKIDTATAPEKLAFTL